MTELEDRRTLVTGGAGFIGANLTRGLTRAGAEVHLLVRPSTRLWRLTDLLPSVTVHRADLTDREGLRQVAAQIRPDIIFHLAVQGVDPKHSDPRGILEANVGGTFNLLEATEPIDYERFVHLGGSSEYGPKDEPMKESDVLEPLTFYGAAKAAATLVCQQFARARRRPLVVLRPFSVYGYWERPTRLIPTAIRAALRNEELTLTAPGYRRDLIFVEDVVEACLRALQAETAPGEIINVGTGKQWTNEEVVDLVQALCGERIRVRAGEYPARLSDTTHWVADIHKAKRLLGWAPRHSLRSGLQKTISWLRLHQDLY